VDTKQEYYRTIVQGLDSGMSMDEAMAPIEAVIHAKPACPRFDPRDLNKMWQRIAAPEVREWRLAYGDEAARELYRRALRSERFVIR
jgi:hypothetical protein